MPIDRESLAEEQPNIPPSLREDSIDFLPIIKPTFFLFSNNFLPHDLSQLERWHKTQNQTEKNQDVVAFTALIKSPETTEQIILIHHNNNVFKYITTRLKIIEYLVLRNLMTNPQQIKAVAIHRTKLDDFNHHNSSDVFVREALLAIILFDDFEEDWPSVTAWLKDKTLSDKSLTRKKIITAINTVYTELSDKLSAENISFVEQIAPKTVQDILKSNKDNYIQSIASEEAKEPHKNKKIISDYVQSFLLLACIAHARKNKRRLSPIDCARSLLQFFKPWFSDYIAAAHCGCFKTFRRFWLVKSSHSDLRTSLIDVLNPGKNSNTLSSDSGKVIVSPATSSKIK